MAKRKVGIFWLWLLVVQRSRKTEKGQPQHLPGVALNSIGTMKKKKEKQLFAGLIKRKEVGQTGELNKNWQSGALAVTARL